eukprot:g61.t1
MRTPFSPLQFRRGGLGTKSPVLYSFQGVVRFGLPYTPSSRVVRTYQRGFLSLAATQSNRQSSGKLLDVSFWKMVETVQSEINELEKEKQKALAQAAKYSQRKERLLQSVTNLYQQAARDVQEGSEMEARKRLVEKAAVMKAMNISQNRSEANAKLVMKLEQVIGEKQQKLLYDIIEAGRHLNDEE